jgi:hypothetical protein
MSEKIKYEHISTSILKNNLIAPESTEEDNDNIYHKESQSQMNSKSNNFRTIERSSNHSRADQKINRVRELSEKLSKIQIQDNERSNIISNLENNFQTAEENLLFSCETLKNKYNTLKDHSSMMKKKLEGELENKDDFKINITEKLKKLQNKARSMILEEKDHFISYSDSICMKLEGEFIKYDTELKRDNDALLININDIKENIIVIKINRIFF